MTLKSEEPRCGDFYEYIRYDTTIRYDTKRSVSGVTRRSDRYLIEGLRSTGNVTGQVNDPNVEVRFLVNNFYKNDRKAKTLVGSVP